jgi:hypothetical protein
MSTAAERYDQLLRAYLIEPDPAKSDAILAEVLAAGRMVDERPTPQPTRAALAAEIEQWSAQRTSEQPEAADDDWHQCVAYGMDLAADLIRGTLMLKRSGHHIAWTIEGDGAIRGTATCWEPEGADCRTYCVHLCEEALLECDNCDEYQHDEVEGRHCARCAAQIRGDNPCNPIEWIVNQDGWQWSYRGPEVPLASGPIEFDWDGDTWTWSYVEVES